MQSVVMDAAAATRVGRLDAADEALDLLDLGNVDFAGVLPSQHVRDATLHRLRLGGELEQI